MAWNNPMFGRTRPNRNFSFNLSPTLFCPSLFLKFKYHFRAFILIKYCFIILNYFFTNQFSWVLNVYVTKNHIITSWNWSLNHIFFFKSIEFDMWETNWCYLKAGSPKLHFEMWIHPILIIVILILAKTCWYRWVMLNLLW